MEPPNNDDPEGSKPAKSVVSEEEEESQKESPPLDPSETGDTKPPLDNDVSDQHESVHSDITSSTKQLSPHNSEQAGCHKHYFEPPPHKLLQRLLEFKSKDTVPVVSSALENNGTRSVVDFLCPSDEDIDSLGFPDDRGFKPPGSSHKQSICVPKVLINDNIDKEGETQSDALKVIATQCIKGCRVCLAKEQRKKPPPDSSSSKPSDHDNITSTDPSETLLATELKRWRATKQDCFKHPTIRDDCDFFSWRHRFMPPLMNQCLTPPFQSGCTVPIDPSERSVHKEKVNCSWTIPVHALQSPKGQAALAQFEPKDCSIQVTLPAVVCCQHFEKPSMDGKTRSRAVQSQSKILNAFCIIDKKFHSRAAFPAAHRKQFNEWMQLKERKLDIDACKSTFFDTVHSDMELSLAAAEMPLSNQVGRGMTFGPC